MSMNANKAKPREAEVRSTEQTFATKRINNEKVHDFKRKLDKDTRPVRGADLFPELYCNIFLCARKKTGKTLATRQILKKCAGPKTKIVVFCATLHKDDTWKEIEEWAKKKGLPFLAYTSIEDDDGKDRLKQLVKELENDEDEEEAEQRDAGVSSHNFLDSESESEDEEPREKYQSPEYIFVLDDLADELHRRSLTTFLKKHRHFKAKIIVSSQHLNDLLPQARRQLDYWILFQGHPEGKVDEIHRSADLAIPKQEFYDMYKFATEKPFSFLYIDTTSGSSKASGSFRRNFDTLIEV